MSTNETAVPDTLQGDMLKGIKAIAAFLGVPDKEAYEAVRNGRLRGAFQIGRIWHARKSRLFEDVRRLEARGD
jgi:hypothetical protein